MSVADFHCRVEAESADGVPKVLAERTYPAQSLMKIGAVRTWVRKAYNKALREAPKDVIISASYRGQMSRSPYNAYSGYLSGVNGQTMREDGGFEK